MVKVFLVEDESIIRRGSVTILPGRVMDLNLLGKQETENMPIR